MRIPIPEERNKLLDIFYPYLRPSKGEPRVCLTEDATEDAKKAFDEYMKLYYVPSSDRK